MRWRMFACSHQRKSSSSKLNRVSNLCVYLSDVCAFFFHPAVCVRELLLLLIRHVHIPRRTKSRLGGKNVFFLPRRHPHYLGPRLCVNDFISMGDIINLLIVSNQSKHFKSVPDLFLRIFHTDYSCGGNDFLM